MTELAIHPAADVYPMLPDDEMQALVDSITENGLFEPLVRWACPETGELYLLDGRNRYAACQLAGIEPDWVDYEGDPFAYVLAHNDDRRHMTTGARAMARAVVLEKAGLRRDGQWDGAKGGRGKKNPGHVAGVSSRRLVDCGLVLDYAPDLVPLVISGNMPLRGERGALTEAQRRRDAASGEEARMSRLAAAAPDLAARVRDDDISLTMAEAEANKREAERQQAIRDARNALQDLPGHVLAYTTSVIGGLQEGEPLDVEPLIAAYRRCIDLLQNPVATANRRTA